MKTIRIEAGIRLDKDVAIVVRDGMRLLANVFRPEVADHPVPIVMSVTPYGKDQLPDWFHMALMRLAGVRFGTLECSRWTGFEAPDPLFWTRAGYAVIQVDVRGMHKSEGHAGALTDDDARDYYDLIEWAALQPWSTGRVGLLGVSYLAMSQWRVAALRPPALKAIVPWEGVTDLLRELGYQDGVLETDFVGTWWRNRMKRGRNPRFAMAEDFPGERDARPLDDAWWAGKRPELSAIEVPALVCASWSDHGLHTRGSLEGFERIASRDKWLFTHGRRKWETFYSDEARTLQKQFFDCYLKGETNDWRTTPRVRLEVRKSRNESAVRWEEAWPPRSASYRPLYLDARTGCLDAEPPGEHGTASYRATRARAEDRATFAHRFDGETELTGTMMLKLWVATSEGDDLDLFVVLRKFDPLGREVCFYGYNGFDRDGVAKGWLRVSHRELDRTRSRPGRPWHTHRVRQPLAGGQIAPVEIEILASCTRFEAGSRLTVEILGHDAAPYPGFRHRRTVNRGLHTIHTGGEFDSHLLAPFVMA